MAPEVFFGDVFSSSVAKVEIAEIPVQSMAPQSAPLQLAFADASFDLVFASYRLEHIYDDRQALEEFSRILKPEGVAFLPVPVKTEKTQSLIIGEMTSDGHVRLAGPDYFDRYADYFSQIEMLTSADAKSEFQTYVIENKSDGTKSHQVVVSSPCYLPICRP